MSAYEFMCEVDFYTLLNHTLVSDFSLNTQKVKILISIGFSWFLLLSGPKFYEKQQDNLKIAKKYPLQQETISKNVVIFIRLSAFKREANTIMNTKTI